MTKLRLSPDLTLPLDAVTQRLAFLGKPGSGKSYAATKLAELMFDAGAQFVALDPVGIWYGLRIDGAGKGLPIPVFGGLHGDVPLEATAGAMIADLIVDRRLSCVLDVSQFEHDTDKARFAAAFLARFYFRMKAAPRAVHVFFEECQEFVPQNPARGEERMLHDGTRMAKLGRNFGIGISLISQRPQEVNKKVLNLTECLFAFQMTGVHERKAIKEWVSTVGADEHILTVLPTLAVAHAHVYSPQWLRFSKMVKIGEKRTADVSSTPAVGASITEGKPLAAVDIAKLRVAMAATIEKAKADDPKELRKKIAQLEEVAAKPGKATAAPVVDQRAVDRAVRIAGQMHEEHYRKLAKQVNRLIGVVGTVAASLDATTLRLRESVNSLVLDEMEAKETAGPSGGGTGERQQAAGREPEVRRPVAPPAPREAVGDGSLSNVQRKILDGLAFFSHLGMVPTRVQLAMHAGYTNPKSPGFTNPLGALRTAGYLDYGNGTVEPTELGAQSGTATNAPETLDELHSVWLSRLPNVHQRILEQLIPTHGTAGMPRAELAAACGYTNPKSPGFTNPLGRLRTLGLIDYGQGTVFTTDALFPAGLR